MRLKWKIMSLAAVLPVLLSGCMLKTMDEMYALPRRSEEYQDLQTAIDQVMVGMEYSAPIQGENQQTVQMADLNGDGVSEALLFAKGTGEKPLKIFIFSRVGDTYENTTMIEAAGTTFEQVEYVEIDDIPGTELVVGRQLGNEVLHSLSVYTFASGQADTILTTGYTRFVTLNVDDDSRREIVVLRPGSDAGNGVAELYDCRNGAVERLSEVRMSVPVESMKRIVTGGMDKNTQAVFVASTYDDSTIITDVFAVVDGKFSNVSLSNDSGTSVKTIRNYYVYGDDIDEDGLIEIPAQVYGEDGSSQELLRWYNLTVSGQEVDKAYTCHNYTERWYVLLEDRWMDTIRVTRGMDVGQTQGYVFTAGVGDHILFAIYAFTGDDREALAEGDQRFVLNRTDEVVYAAQIGWYGQQEGVTPEILTKKFNFIQEDWRTGET